MLLTIRKGVNLEKTFAGCETVGGSLVQSNIVFFFEILWAKAIYFIVYFVIIITFLLIVQ